VRLRKLAGPLLRVADLLLFLLVYPAAILLKFVRRGGVHRMPLSRRALLDVGVFPIRDHYYEPLFDTRSLQPLSEVRSLPGVDWNEAGQLELLAGFDYAEEFEREIRNWQGTPAFHFDNDAFEGGDADFWYSMVRKYRPANIIEIGSGFSTLIAAKAIEINRRLDPEYRCRHVCIEPYEMPWLEKIGVTVLRKKTEELDVAFFSTLGPNDVLFIDSSHIIRPQGDVLFEFLQVLPTLRPGVIVHVHDIFSPRDYLESWVRDEVRLWNEQYLLEAFLTHNDRWRIMAALNFLRHEHYDALKAKCPFLRPDLESGSFYIQRVR
jgi:hypothetical protein